MKINLAPVAQRPAPFRLGCFILCLLMLWLPFAAPIYLFVADSNLVSIVTMVILYGEFIFLLRVWGKQLYEQTQIFPHYGLELSQINGVNLLNGLAIGSITVLMLFAVQGFFGWVEWQQPKATLLGFILEGLLVGLATGFAEELFFRGWLLDELERDYSLPVALWVNATLFAVLHFIRPLEAIINTWPQFFGLLLLGLTLVWAKRWCRGRLGLSIGLHGGLIWGYYIVNVGELTKYTDLVPEWVTGVNKNPLAGVMGLVFLGAIALWIRSKAMQNSEPATQK